jgi:hypothetical protein
MIRVFDGVEVVGKQCFMGAHIGTFALGAEPKLRCMQVFETFL